MAFLASIVAHKVLILSVLLGISESLALIPQVQSNSVFQLIYSAVQKLKALVTPSAPQA